MLCTTLTLKRLKLMARPRSPTVVSLLSVNRPRSTKPLDSPEVWILMFSESFSSNRMPPWQLCVPMPSIFFSSASKTLALKPNELFNPVLRTGVACPMWAEVEVVLGHSCGRSRRRKQKDFIYKYLHLDRSELAMRSCAREIK